MDLAGKINWMKCDIWNNEYGYTTKILVIQQRYLLYNRDTSYTTEILVIQQRYFLYNRDTSYTTEILVNHHLCLGLNIFYKR
jgi:hypothetical protein